jgi:uncharacterized protein YjbJ (UPF0337 family)
MSGTSDKLKGKVKETAGAATDDDQLRAEGKADQKVGDIKDKVEGAIDTVKDKLTGK